MKGACLLELQLLDPNGEYVAAKWSFSSRQTKLVRVGRAQDNEVVIADRFVSRYHAEFEFADGRWSVHVLGRHGMSLAGVALGEEFRPLDEGRQELMFGGSGSLLRAVVETALGAHAERKADLTTMLFAESLGAVPIAIDEADKSRAVEEIVGGEFFQALRAVRQRAASRDALDAQAAHS